MIFKNGLKSLKSVSLQSFKDSFKLSLTYVRINRRFILVATIGLILAIGAISQTLFYSRSVEVQLVEDILDNPEYSYDPPMKIGMDFYVYWEGEYDYQSSISHYPFKLDDFLEIQTNVNQAISTVDTSIIDSQTFSCQFYIEARSQNYPINDTYDRYLHDFTLIGIPQEQFLSLGLPIERGTLPNSTHPIILVESTYPRDYTYDYYDDAEKEMVAEIESDLEIALYSSRIGELNSSYAQNISISGISKLDTLAISDEVSQKLGGIFTVWSNRKVLLCSLENMVDICNYFNQFIVRRCAGNAQAGFG